MNAPVRAPLLSPAELIAKYERRAPRYTSYPTAVQFGPDVTAEVYRGWLQELPVDRPVSLYAHVPFCAQLCWYCGCNTRAVNSRRPIADYVGVLLEEIAMLRAATPDGLRAGAVHLGGGTPNMLDGDELLALFAGLRTVAAFEADIEIAAELDPGVLTRDWVKAAARCGLNRASLGVQNLAPEVQAAVNRPERLEDIAACVAWLRDAGVQSVNLDLMYGLPRQTVANTLSTLDGVLTLRPDRLALFGYAHVPWVKPHQKLIAEADLPSPAERLDQAEAAAERLAREGYVRIGLDHFALPSDPLAVAAREGRLHRNFQGYTTDAATTLLGVGASAISTTPSGFAQNVSQELGWRQAVGRGELPIARGVAITAEDRFRGEIIERLMCDLAVDLSAVCARHGRAPQALDGERARLAGFQRDGLAVLDGDVLRITEAGRQVVRGVCAVFDPYLDEAGARHSTTI